MDRPGRQSPRGAPIKKKETVYRLLDRVAFGEVLSGEAEISFRLLARA